MIADHDWVESTILNIWFFVYDICNFILKIYQICIVKKNSLEHILLQNQIHLLGIKIETANKIHTNIKHF